MHKSWILVIIDDIDRRLTPEETRQLFTVVKALADFPNVVYLLAFDREVAAQAIEQIEWHAGRALSGEDHSGAVRVATGRSGGFASSLVQAPR